MKTKITTDWHVAAKRSAGTTPYSAIALRDYLQAALVAQLDDNDHLIAGDLLDDFTVDTAELVKLYQGLSDWLSTYKRKLCLLRGNHDYHQSGAKQSSFDLLGTILTNQFPDQVTVANEVTEWKQFTLIPHLGNMELFNLAVESLKDVQDRVLVFHANIDSVFCEDSQHSLNLTRAQIKDFVDRGNLVISGHEHQKRDMFNGRCLVLGNGAPSSIADCLGNSQKFSATVIGTDYIIESTWQAEGNFQRINWRNLIEVNDEAKFIRVEGDCNADEAADMVNAIAKLRQRHSCYVLANSVRVEGMAEMNALTSMSTESISKFNVLEALLSELTEAEGEVVKGLLND